MLNLKKMKVFQKRCSTLDYSLYGSFEFSMYGSFLYLFT